MSKFGSNQELHTRLGQGLERLNNDHLSIEEFESLLNDSRELYERLLIIRFKAFEKHQKGESLIFPAEPEAPKVSVSTKNETEIPEVENLFALETPADVEQLIVPDVNPGIEFSIFDDSQLHAKEVEKSPEPIELLKNEQVKEEPKIEHAAFYPESTVPPVKAVEESIPVQEVPKSQPSIPPTPHAGGSLLERLAGSGQSNRLADQLKKTRIDAIATSLTLNDRIRFAKNLFAGNSEIFNAAVLLLDSQRSLTEAQEQLRQYAERFSWNQDDKNTMDFYELVERRYA